MRLGPSAYRASSTPTSPEGASGIGHPRRRGAVQCVRGLLVARRAEAEARRVFDETLRARGWLARARPFDDGVDARVRIVSGGFGRRGGTARLRTRFLAPLACEEGRFVLRLPPPPDLPAAPVPVEVRFALGPDRLPEAPALDGTATPLRGGRAQARSRNGGFVLSFGVRTKGAPPPAVGAPVQALAGREPGSDEIALGLCRPRPPAAGPLPERLLLLVDRSRSVGPAGLSFEREVARTLLEALPPALRFEAIVFDRAATPLFPTFRTATREAIAALDEALVPSALSNGSDLVGALRAAAALVKEESTPAWIVLVTDGALPDAVTPRALADAVALLPAGASLSILVARPAGDEPPVPGALASLAAAAAPTGGLLRALPVGAAGEAVARIVADLRGGGDLFLGRPAVAIGPGEGRLLRLGAGPGGTIEATWRGARRPLSVAPVGLPRSGGPARHGGAAVAGGVAALLELAPPEPAAIEAGVRGEMERSVVKNAIALSFLPRARACYLRRPVKNGGDLDLRGRVRLELHLERGEMVEAAITRSTLGRPAIEACLRDAAFALDVPRAVGNDAPVLAALNLVFQPTTPAKSEPSSVGDEIELILGPPSSDFDPRSLLEPDDR